jgi:hypothetical protein
MTYFVKLSRFLFAACLLAALFASVARPLGVRTLTGVAPSMQRPTPLEQRTQAGQAFGLYSAIVISKPDPHMRVQVAVPALNISGEWASPCVPVGSTATPGLQSRVWVMFEQANPHMPVWMGVPGN